jgi:hypothetical protein
MGIGGGITLVVLGLILLMGVIQMDVPFVDERALGVILVLGGIASVVLALTIWRDRRPFGYVGTRAGTDRVVERRVVERDVDDPNYL